jgi:hypothetical protein
MGSKWKVTLRLGPRVVHERADTLPDAIAELRISLVAVAEQAPGEGASAIFRDYDAAEVVVARGELRGPGGVRAGLDVRADGSSEAWVGRLTKRPVEPQDGEDAYQALERELTPSA